LFNGTIRDNIAYGRIGATEDEIVRAARAAHADHFIRTLPQGYDTVLNEEASNFYYFEARGNNVFCIAAGVDHKLTNEYRIKDKLYELEARLPQNRFLRVSKSYIVNIDNVNEIIPWFGRRLILRFVDGKREIEVSRNYVKNLKEYLGM
jgi:DNA-binding LytR/AlgR family response regulator